MSALVVAMRFRFVVADGRNERLARCRIDFFLIDRELKTLIFSTRLLKFGLTSLTHNGKRLEALLKILSLLTYAEQQSADIERQTSCKYQIYYYK